MAAAWTTVPTVRAWLVNSFRASLLAAYPDVPCPVFYGHPGNDIPARYVAVDPPADIAHNIPGFPYKQGNVEEEYVVPVVAWNAIGDQEADAQQAVTEAAWALVEVLDAAIRAPQAGANPPGWTLGGQVRVARFTHFRSEEFFLTEGRAAQIEADLTINVRV